MSGTAAGRPVGNWRASVRAASSSRVSATAEVKHVQDGTRGLDMSEEQWITRCLAALKAVQDQEFGADSRVHWLGCAGVERQSDLGYGSHSQPW